MRRLEPCRRAVISDGSAPMVPGFHGTSCFAGNTTLPSKGAILGGMPERSFGGTTVISADRDGGLMVVEGGEIAVGRLLEAAGSLFDD